MKHRFIFAAVVLIAGVAIIGCLRTRSEVDVKPVDINLNITGRLELVITDARRQEEEIAGGKPKRTVRPEDIGLPPVPKTPSTGPGAMLMDGIRGVSVVLVSTAHAAELGDDSQSGLIQKMAARHPQIAALLGTKAAGESHTGLLVPRTSLSAAQQALVDAENADRMALYELAASKKGTSVDQAALGYYLARLEHVEKGTWAERYDKSKNVWEWFEWDR